MRFGVAQTKTNQSAIAIANLKQQGFGFWNPRINEMIMMKGRRVTWRRAQLFKDYLFVEVTDRWRSLCGTRGIARLIMNKEDEPAIVRKSDLDHLRSLVDPETGLINLKPRGKFEAGQSVQFKSGPFAWEQAIYDCHSGKDRAYVLMSLLGKSNRVEVDESSLIAA